MESETITHFPLNWAPQKLVAKKSEKAFLEKLIKSREKAAGESRRETIYPGLPTPSQRYPRARETSNQLLSVSFRCCQPRNIRHPRKISNTKESGQNKHKQKMEIKLETTLREKEKKKKERERVITIFKENEQTDTAFMKLE